MFTWHSPILFSVLTDIGFNFHLKIPHLFLRTAVLTRLQVISWNRQPTGNDKTFNDSSEVPVLGVTAPLIPCVLSTWVVVPEATPSFVTLSERWLQSWCCWGYKRRLDPWMEQSGTNGACVWGMSREMALIYPQLMSLAEFKFTCAEVKTRIRGW